MKTKRIFTLILLIVITTISYTSAQTSEQDKADRYLSMKWKQVATGMPDDWYASEQAKAVAENVLLCQKDIGGWAKNKEYHHVFTEAEEAEFEENKGEIGATFDNGATITELKFLAKVYSHLADERYKQAFEKGLDYIFAAQYANGGWPQFFPVRTGKNVAYSGHITYNDDAMVNTMRFLQDIAANSQEYAALNLTNETKAKAREAFNKGVQCIIKTQIVVDGKPTVWCAQHDAQTLAPANARKYELASYSGAESVNIVLLLMSIDNPSADVITAVNGAALWFEHHKVEGIKLDEEVDKDGNKNKIVVEAKNAPPQWARFYDLETEKPFFCDRDGIKKNSLAEIGSNRRNGYRWYTDSPSNMLEKYATWQKKWNITTH